MSEAVLDQRKLTTNSSRLWRVLIWKEFREVGFYAVSLILFGIGFLLFTIAIDFKKTFGMELGSAQASIANVLPMLLVLACAGASYAIEKENKTYNLFRSLPIPAASIFWIKAFVITTFVLVSCAICWPFAYFLILNEGPDKFNFVAGLQGTGISMVEAMLWAFFFSLREKQVVNAIIKACVGLILISNGIAVLSWFDMSNYQLDAVYFWLKITCRYCVGIFLVFGIRSALKSWHRDPSTTATGTRERDSVSTISTVRTTSISPIQRLIWLQFRSAWFPYLVLATANLVLIYATSHNPNAQYVEAGFGQLFWSLSIACLGGLSISNISRSAKFLVAMGFKPITIWLCQLAIPLAFCLSTTFLFYFWTESSEFTLDILLSSTLISFFLGQLAGFIWQSVTLVMFLSVVFGFLGYTWLAISWSGFPSVIPTVLLLAFLPAVLIVGFYKRRILRGSLGWRFWLVSPTLFILFATPMPLMRIYSVPNVQENSVRNRFVKPQSYPSEQLAEIRQIGDELIELYTNKTRQRQLNKVDVTKYDQPLDQDILGDIRQHELAMAAIQTSATMEMLLNNDENDVRDFQRTTCIQQAVRSIVRDAVYYRYPTRRYYTPEIPFEFVNKAIKEFDDWSLNTIGTSYFLNWWLARPEVTRQDVEDLLRKVENYNNFPKYRIYEQARLRFSEAAFDLDPAVFPEQICQTQQEAFWFATFVRLVPWEVSRFKRQQLINIKHSLDVIDLLEGHGDQPLIVDGQPIVEDYDRRQHRSLFNNFHIMFHYYSVDSHPYYESYRQQAAIYLALTLWRIDHDGQLPESLQELETKGYLTKLPREPMEGEPYRLAKAGLTSEQWNDCSHIDFDFELEEMRKLSTFEVPESADQLPFFWINQYRKPRIKEISPREDWIKIQSVEEFTTKKGNSDILAIPLLPIKKEWK